MVNRKYLAFHYFFLPPSNNPPPLRILLASSFVCISFRSFRRRLHHCMKAAHPPLPTRCFPPFDLGDIIVYTAGPAASPIHSLHGSIDARPATRPSPGWVCRAGEGTDNDAPVNNSWTEAVKYSLCVPGRVWGRGSPAVTSGNAEKKNTWNEDL